MRRLGYVPCGNCKKIGNPEERMNQPERRFRIEQGLDRLMDLSRAWEFQNLAFHVMKRLYPGLVLSEWSHDGGEDAFALPGVDASPNTPSVASSLTATLPKVKADCARLRDRGVRPPHVVFVTPKPVRRTTIDQWKVQIEREFGHGLEVVSRNGLVAELEQPELAWVCREYLGIDAPGAVDAAAIGARARAATGLGLQSWEAQGGDPARHVVLTMRPVEAGGSSDAVSVATVDIIATGLRGARRLILFGPPGGGKTVTLTQVARALYAGRDTHAPVVLPAAEWSTSGSSLIDFVAAELTLTVEEVHRLDEAGRLVLLINGWNEIAEAARTPATHALSTFGRRLPNTGILLTTRLSSDRPALPRAEAFQLDSLSRDARRELIQRADVPDADHLISDLERDDVLDAVTRTPLFLAMAIAIVREGRPLPRSPWALLDGFVHGVEQGEHALAFIEASKGQYRRYLADLAAQLTRSGGTSLRADEALGIIGGTSTGLVQEGLVGQPPDARAVLQALTAHHLLVATSGPPGTVRFLHQQFQAWAGAEWLGREVAHVRSDGSGEAVAALQREVLNRPSWNDMIHLLVDRLSQGESPDAADTLRDLLRWLVPLDPLFAASCVLIGRGSAWAAIGESLTATFRVLRERPSQEEQAYALAGMLATANPAFGDVVWPLLESDDMQVRLATLRAWVPFSLRSLGRAWFERWSRWTPDRRAEFVNEVLLNGRADERHEVFAVASADKSPEVRAAAIGMLDLTGDLDAAVGLLGIDPALWARPEAADVIQALSGDASRRLDSTLRSAAALAPVGRARWPLLRGLANAGVPNSIEAIQETCAAAPLDHLAADVLPYLHTVEPEWTTNWVLARIENGEEVPETIAALAGAPDPDQVRALVRLALRDRANGNAVHRRLTPLLYMAPLVATPILLEELRAAIHRDNTAGDEAERTFWHRCEDLLRAVPLTARTAAVLALGRFPCDEADVELLRRLFGPGSPMEVRDVDDISAEQRAALRGMVLSARDVITPTSLYARHFRAEIAALLGSFGEPSDTATLLAWAREDSVERRRLLDASEPGAAMSYANWYAGAFVRLGSPTALAAVEQLLDDPEYLGDASVALVALVGTDEAKEASRVLWRPDYRQARARRTALTSGTTSLPAERAEVVRARRAIREGVTRHLTDLDAGSSTPAPYRFRQAAGALGQLGDASAVPLLLDLGRRPGCEWGVIDGLETLVLQGVALPGADTAAVVEPLIDAIASERATSSEDPWWFGLRCLAVLLLSDAPHRGVEQVRRVLPVLASHHVHDVMALLAACQAHSAEALLLELLRTTGPNVWWYHELVAAVGAYRSGAVTTALLEVLDKTSHPGTSRIPHETRDALARALGRLAREDATVLPMLQARACEATDPGGRELLAAVLREVGNDAAALVTWDLLRDVAPNPIPSGVEAILRDATHRHEPVEASGNSYFIFPRAAPELRAQLFMLLTTDPTRRESARRLLLTMEVDRIETGRPIDEPRHPGPVGSTPVVAIWPAM